MLKIGPIPCVRSRNIKTLEPIYAVDTECNSQKAADLYVRIEGGRIREAADVLGRAACLQIRNGNYSKAIQTVGRERDLRIEAKSYEAAARTNWLVVLTARNGLYAFA